MALCPDPVPRVQTLFTRSDAAFIGTVVSEHGVDEKGKKVSLDSDNGYINSVEICFRIKTTKIFSGPKAEFVDVYNGNDSGRMGLSVGDTYLIFAAKDKDGKLFGYCDDATDSTDPDYSEKIVELNEVIKNIEKGMPGDIRSFVGRDRQSGIDGIPNIHFVISGNGKTYTAVSDAKGWFRISVPAGHYSVKPAEPKWNIELSDYCWENSDDLDVRTAGGADLGFVASPK
jgi:hypothetical protein